MVSSKLTEEEEFLKRQFQTLKNLKKELKQLTLKRKQEQVEAAENGPPTAKQKKAIIQANKTPNKPHEFSSGGPNYNTKPSKALNAAANTEAAKKLLKTGAIQIQVEKKTSFKRSSTFKRRSSNLAENEGKPRKPVFQSFSTGSESTEEDVSDNEAKDVGREEQAKPVFKPYGGGKEGRSKFARRDRKTEKKAQRRGNTLYVYGFAVDENMIRKNFSTFGNIVNVNMEHGKNSGFVSYDSFESAEQAIKEMDDALVDDCRIKVSLARHQPMLESVKSSTPWAGLAAERGDKGSVGTEMRSLVTYEDDSFF